MGHNSKEKIVRNSQLAPVFFMKDSQVTHFFKCPTSFMQNFKPQIRQDRKLLIA